MADLPSFSKSPHRSTHSLSQESGVSRTTIGYILATHKCHPYKVQLLHHLNEDHPDHHVEFVEWVSRQLQRDPHFTETVLFSDEAHFYLNGEVNKQNLGYWSDTNPHWTDPAKMVVVWCVGEEDSEPILYRR